MEILTDLLRAEATHRHAASIRYRMAAARLPVVKDIDAFRFEGTPINEGLVRSLHSGAFLPARRSEEHTSELQSLMRISYAVFCLKKKKKRPKKHNHKPRTSNKTI